MIVRQSDLKLWQACPLKYRFSHIDKLPREQSGSLTFGSIIHDVILLLETTGDIAACLARFCELWDEPTLLGPEYAIAYYVRGTNWKKYREEGIRILKAWWDLIAWDSDVVLGREYSFDVPIGDGHILHGTIDKLLIRNRPKLGQRVLMASDYKTSKKQPTYDYLAEDLQFSAYTYATTRPEFWANMTNGAEIMASVAQMPRWGEWVQLTGPKRIDAGPRTQRHYNRLEMAVNAIAESVALRIFVPTISGESCRYCEFRQLCGLPELDADGQELPPA